MVKDVYTRLNGVVTVVSGTSDLTTDLSSTSTKLDEIVCGTKGSSN